jgi:pimeloyl-ACP methyl ester carboxylesterase
MRNVIRSRVCRAAPLDGTGGSCTWRGAVKTAGLPRLCGERHHVPHDYRAGRRATLRSTRRGGALLAEDETVLGGRRRTRRDLSALRLAPAAVLGTSSGATFALRLTITRPELVRGAVRHEPMPAALYDDPSAGRARSRRAGSSASGASSPGTRTGTASSPACARGCWPRRDVLHRRSRDVRELSAG